MKRIEKGGLSLSLSYARGDEFNPSMVYLNFFGAEGLAECTLNNKV